MSGKSPEYHLAYVFERFPSFTQTFCVREVLELERLGLRPLIFSIHDTRAENIRHFPSELLDRVQVLPPADQLVDEIKQRKSADEFPQGIVLTLRHWGERPDKQRIYEAAWIGAEMQRYGVRHAHTHFAGIGARTCWWMRQFFGHSFTFTGHANDIFRAQDQNHAVTLKQLIHDAATVVTVSDYSVNRLTQRAPSAKRKIHRVYNGLDLQPFQSAVAKKKSNPPLILSVGRLIEKKGFDDLIRAARNLRSRNRDFRCGIVGDGPLETDLRQLIAETETEDAVALLGPKSQEEIIQLLGKSTLFALPCVTEKDGGMDNLPTVIMEAMAAGVPCISTELAGVPEMVIHGSTGLVVPERQPERIADAIDSLLSDPGLRESMGSKAIAVANERFAKEVTARQFARILIQNGTIPFDGQLSSRSGPARPFDYVQQAIKRGARSLTWKNRIPKRPLEKLDPYIASK